MALDNSVSKRLDYLVAARAILTAMEGGEADALLSSERLSNDSPVMWPDQHHFCEQEIASLSCVSVLMSSPFPNPPSLFLLIVGDFNPLVSLNYQ